MKYLCESCVNFPCTKDMNMLALSCPVYSPEPKPITNADRIRHMTDEELAEFLETLCPSYKWAPALNGMTWLDWLKQEASE